MKARLFLTTIFICWIGLSPATAAYVANGDGTVTDTDAGLMWQQATPVERYNWQGALGYCNGLSLAGHTDWRLPNRNELQSLVDYSRFYPVIDETYFPGTSGWYWSSSSKAGNTLYAWVVYFNYGHVVSSDNGDLSGQIRAVRAGQCRSLGHLVISNPVQGDIWELGDTMPITWNTQAIGGNVEISLSRSGGETGTFSTIVGSTPNDGSYNWTVSGPFSANCVLKIVPLSAPSMETSQGLFTIAETAAPAAVISGAPPAYTNQNDTVLQVGGATVINYQYCIDSGAYSNPAHTSENIDLTGLPDGPITVDVIGMDVRGTWQTTPTTVSWTVDTVPPSTGSITIANTSGKTSDPTPKLTLSSIGADFMRLAAGESGLSAASWVPYASSYDQFNISAGGDGIKSIWVEFKDRAQNIQTIHTYDTVYYEAVPPFTLNPDTLDIYEPSDTSLFSLTLGAAPTGQVSVALSGCAGMAVPSDNTVLFTPSAWQNISTAVTAIDNYRVDGTRSCTLITAPAAGEDSDYTGKNPDDLTVYIHDNDLAGIDITPTALTVAEPHDEAVFTVRLKSEPANPVTITFSINSSQAEVDPASVIMNSDNWNIGEIVTVTARDDADIDGTQTCAVITEPAQSADPHYSGMDAPDVTVKVQDDDTAAVLVSSSSVTVDEPEGLSGFTVKLSTQPTAPVTVSLNRSNEQCTLMPDSLTFTTANTPQSVLVQAVDDGISDGTQNTVINLSANSADENYQLPNAKTVTVTVNDAPSAGVQILSLYPALAQTNAETRFTVRGSGFGTASSPRVTRVSILPEAGGTEIDADEFTVLDDSHMRFTLTAPGAEGIYNLKIYVNTVSEEMDQALTLAHVLPVYKAVIILGRAGPNAPIWEYSRQTAHKAYQTLMESGFMKENIHYLSSEGNTDIDQDGEPDDWDGDATLSNVQNAIAACAGGVDAAQFVLFMIGDGYSGFMRLSETEVLTARDLSGWMNGLPTSLEKIVVYDGCYSGSFIPELANLSNRVVITSTDADSLAFIQEGHSVSFATFFWSKIRARYPVGPSFDYARDEMPGQIPQIDYSAGIDVDNLYIGLGGTPMTDTPAMGPAPAPKTLLPDHTADTVTVGPVTDSQDIGGVRAIVRTPCGRNREIIFTVSEAKGFYEGLIDRLIFQGTYDITIRAEDTLGYLSESSLKTTINKNDGIQCHEPDLTLDGNLDLSDAILGLKILTGAPYRENPEDNYEKLDIDVGGNLVVGLEEVVFILRILANL